VSLPDSVEPDVINFAPPNSARGVSVNVSLAFFFNEGIKISDNANPSESVIELFALGGNISDTQSDVKVGEIALDDPRIAFDRDMMLVDLSGMLSYSRYYSLSLPAAVISDSANNEFTGLHMGLYTFETQEDVTEEELEDNEEEVIQTQYIILASVGGVLFIAAVVLTPYVFRNMCSNRKTAKVISHKNDQVEAMQAAEQGLSPMQTASNFRLEVEEDDWNDSVTGPASPFATSGFSWKAGSSATSFHERMGRPVVQVISKPVDPKVDIDMQMRSTGTLTSLAQTHENSSFVAKQIAWESGGSEDEKRIDRPPLRSPTSPPKFLMDSHLSPASSPKGHRDRKHSRSARSLSSSPSRGQSKAKLAWQAPADGKASPSNLALTL